MQCELCQKEIARGLEVVPVGTIAGLIQTQFHPRGAIHLSCLQEITSFVKAMSDTLRSNTTNDEETD